MKLEKVETKRVLLFAAVFVLLFVGCGDGGSGPSGNDGAYTPDVEIPKAEAHTTLLITGLPTVYNDRPLECTLYVIALFDQSTFYPKGDNYVVSMGSVNIVHERYARSVNFNDQCIISSGKATLPLYTSTGRVGPGGEDIVEIYTKGGEFHVYIELPTSIMSRDTYAYTNGKSLQQLGVDKDSLYNLPKLSVAAGTITTVAFDKFVLLED